MLFYREAESLSVVLFPESGFFLILFYLFECNFSQITCKPTKLKIYLLTQTFVDTDVNVTKTAGRIVPWRLVPLCLYLMDAMRNFMPEKVVAFSGAFSVCVRGSWSDLQVSRE